ncbi:SDR family NAD(P)-dependent oxidoreductase [Glacieibacterium frigidum]|nr:SDR family oxidoreductase [Glacieibacterium frigidum]
MSGSRPVLVVTGGGQGIGRAIVLLAAARGYDVAFTYRSDSGAAERAQRDAAQAGADVLALQADMGERDAVFAAFDRTMAHFGRIDAVINNAGVIGAPRAIAEVDTDHLSDVFRNNVFSIFYSVGAAVKHMSVQNGGRGGAIVNMSSAAARHGGMPNETHYAASKGAVDSLTLALAKDLPAHGMRVNTLRPGLIRTAIHAVHGGEATISAASASVPLGRAGTAEEVAETALFLISDASSYVHGATLDVSGGR